MTYKTRWLDELPLDAPERELLLAGRAARPPAGAVDAEWQALGAALGATVVASSAATSGVAVNAAAAKTASAAMVTKAAAVAPWVVTAKWFALGAALGCGMAGASAVVQRAGQGDARDVTAPSVAAAPAAVRKTPSSPGAGVAPPSLESPSVAPAASVDEPPAHAARADVAARREPPVASEPPVANAGAASGPGTAALAQQARELAEVKRLIDAGSTAEAFRRLDATYHAGAPFALAEERDALEVQALGRAQRREEARLAARQFLVRYPNSPYLETMQRLLAGE